MTVTPHLMPACNGLTVAWACRVDHNIKGQGIYAYVVLAKGTKATPELKKKLNDVVRNQIGSFAVPDTIHWAPGRPSGVTFMLYCCFGQ